MISGLTSGLAAAAADGGVLWLCTALSDADREAARLGARADAHGEPAVRMLEIPPAVFDAAYNGIANSILWFVHHLLFDTPNAAGVRRAVPPRLGRLPRLQRGVRGRAGGGVGGGHAGAHPGLPPGPDAEDAARPAPGGADRALRAHAVGAARVLPDAAGRRGLGHPRRHARRRPRRVPRRALGLGVPRLLRGGARRAGDPRLGRRGPGFLPGPGHRRRGAPARRRRGGAARAGGRRRRAAPPWTPWPGWPRGGS